MELPTDIVSGMDWLSEDQLLLLYSEKGRNRDRSQIGLVSISGGKVQPVTRDTNSYVTLTLSADKKARPPFR